MPPKRITPRDIPPRSEKHSEDTTRFRHEHQFSAGPATGDRTSPSGRDTARSSGTPTRGSRQLAVPRDTTDLAYLLRRPKVSPRDAQHHTSFVFFGNHKSLPFRSQRTNYRLSSHPGVAMFQAHMTSPNGPGEDADAAILRYMFSTFNPCDVHNREPPRKPTAQEKEVIAFGCNETRRKANPYPLNQLPFVDKIFLWTTDQNLQQLAAESNLLLRKLTFVTVRQDMGEVHIRDENHRTSGVQPLNIAPPPFRTTSDEDIYRWFDNLCEGPNGQLQTVVHIIDADNDRTCEIPLVYLKALPPNYKG